MAITDKFKTQLNAIQIAVNEEDFGTQASVVLDGNGDVIAEEGALELQRTSPKLEEIHTVSGLTAGASSSLALEVPASALPLDNYSDGMGSSYTGAGGYSGYLGGFKSLWDAAMLLDTEAQAAKVRDDAEAVTARAAEGVLTVELDAQEAKEAAYEVSNDAALASEIATARAAELVIAGELDVQEAKEAAYEVSNDAALAAEIATARAAEGTNATILSAEIADRIADVDAEEVRALAAEAAELARALAAEVANANAIAAETVDRRIDVDAEEARALAAEAAEQARALTAEAANAAAIAAEEARAGAAEAEMQEFGSPYAIRENASTALMYGNTGFSFYDAADTTGSGPDEWFSQHWYMRQEAITAGASDPSIWIPLRLQEASKHSLSLNGMELMPATEMGGLLVLHDEAVDGALLGTVDASSGAWTTTLLDNLFDTDHPNADYVVTTTGDVYFRADVYADDAIKFSF